MLFVDIGNSRIKWLSRESLSLGQRAESVVYLADSMQQLLDRRWGPMSTPSRVIVASVAEAEINQAVADWVNEHWNLQANFLASQSQQCGVKNGYQHPGELGVDRWMALIGCRHIHKGSACVVDLGTAVTVDLLDSSGAHSGGVIAPGLRMMKEALLGGTAIRANRVAETSTIDTLARTTADGAKTGAAWAVAGLIDYAHEYAACTLGEDVQLFLCGGDAPRIQPLLHRSHRYEPDLVLTGVAAAANGMPKTTTVLK